MRVLVNVTAVAWPHRHKASNITERVLQGLRELLTISMSPTCWGDARNTKLAVAGFEGLQLNTTRHFNHKFILVI
uniref:Uncharacterized protein n=1 Tax=Octopus bimaculoides TaxID=37653 RepID=A0A0L8G3N2_OCTBM